MRCSPCDRGSSGTSPRSPEEWMVACAPALRRMPGDIAHRRVGWPTMISTVSFTLLRMGT